LNPQDGSLQQKTSFYFPLLLLPREKREAMEILYRFCWAADDISDSPAPLSAKRKKLAAFKRELKACFKGRASDPLFQKLQSIFRSFQMSPEPLERILKGVERDLKPIRFRTFFKLHRYALQVAGGPGLASMEIFGFKDRAHRIYAENLGVYLQIVNMTRDYREDRELGRFYLPAEDFQRFKLNPFSIQGENPAWKNFVVFQLDRAGKFLEKSHQALSCRQRSGLVTAEAIAAVYGRLAEKLKKYPERIPFGKVSLSKFEKLRSVGIAAGRAFLWKRLST